MVALRICPICRKAVYVEAADTIVARVRGASDDLLTYFHRHCYPATRGPSSSKWTSFRHEMNQPEGKVCPLMAVSHTCRYLELAPISVLEPAVGGIAL